MPSPSRPQPLPPKPTTPVQRTIQASLPPARASSPSERGPSEKASEKRAAQPRVYTSDRRRYDADFDRSLSTSEFAPRSAATEVFEYPQPVRPASRAERDDSEAEADSKTFKRAPRPKADPDKAASDRQLFDPRQHDPVKFKAAQKPGKPVAGPTAVPHVPQSGDGSSRGGRRRARTNTSGSETSDPKTVTTGSNPAVERLKKSYRRIVSLEEKRLAEAEREKERKHEVDFDREDGGPVSLYGSSLRDDDYWLDQVNKHKEYALQLNLGVGLNVVRLAEAHFQFLQMALDGRLPPSHQSMPQKYNTPSRLWQHGFHLLLERLRHAMPLVASKEDNLVSTDNLLDYLIDFIQYAYIYYTALLEEHSMAVFRPVWLEQLGDLARYRMAVAGLVNRLAAISVEPGHELSQGRVAHLASAIPAARIDDNESAQDEASIGGAALNDWEVDDAAIWKTTAIDWYGKGLNETPGTGRLHHYLALLSKGDDLRTLYHFCRRSVHSPPIDICSVAAV